jgi:hypothetical protein
MPDRWSLVDALKQAVEKSRVDRQIETNVRAGARGKSREEARKLLVDELQAHCEDVPPQPMLDVKLDAILASGSPLGRVQVTAQALKALGQSGAQLLKIFRDQDGGETGGADAQGRWFFPIPGDQRRTAEVELTDGVQEWLGHLEEEVTWEFWGMSHVHLELHPGVGDTLEVRVADRRVGVLVGPETEEFRPLLSLLGDRGEMLTTTGYRYHAPDGRWHIYVHLPLEDFQDLLNTFGQRDEPD